MNGETMEQIADRLRAASEAVETERLRAAREFPPPEVASTDPWPEDFVAPGPTASLRLLAERNGWTVRMTYSRGHLPHGTTGVATALRHTVAVRMYHPETHRGGWATYTSPVASTDWSWNSIMLAGRGQLLFPYATITDMKEWIKARGEMDPSWFSVIRRQLRAKAEQKAARPAKPGRKKGVMA